MIVAVAVSVSIVLLVLVSMGVLIILTHQKWTHQTKDGEENSETELKPSAPPLHIMKSQQAVGASSTQVHPQQIHKPATVIAGQTMMPALESIICWDNDGKGS